MWEGARDHIRRATLYPAIHRGQRHERKTGPASSPAPSRSHRLCRGSYFVRTRSSRRPDAVVAVLLTVTVAVPDAGTASLKCLEPPDRIVPE